MESSHREKERWRGVTERRRAGEESLREGALERSHRETEGRREDAESRIGEPHKATSDNM